MSAPAGPTVGGARVVREERLAGDVPLWVHPGWAERMPWLAQGTTGRGDGAEPWDLGLSGDSPVGGVLDRWRALRGALGTPRAVHARQVHGAEMLVHRGGGAPGLLVGEGVDGHLTDEAGLLLSVSVADCVPVSVVDPARRGVALVHAGWRGTAEGIAERAVRRLGAELGSEPADLLVHCGPAICGRCYEVGPEVHAAIHPGRESPAGPTPIDVRAAVAERVVALGVAAERVTVSAHCTKCGPGGFFSHRGGDPQRQMGVLGVRG